MMTRANEQQRVSEGRSSRSMLRALISAMRPLQAPKNGLVLVPLIFSVNIWFAFDDLTGMVEIVLRAVGATVAFTLLSGAVYLINDLADVERDRTHPVKRNRAIASGDLPVGMARISAVIAVLMAGLISIAISLPLTIVALAYLLLNVAYTFKLKHVAILDVMSVAAGFVLRAYAGYIAIGGPMPWVENGVPGVDIDVSPWFYIMTALGFTSDCARQAARRANYGRRRRGATARHSRRIYGSVHRRVDNEHRHAGDLHVRALRHRLGRHWCERSNGQHDDGDDPVRCLWDISLSVSAVCEG